MAATAMRLHITLDDLPQIRAVIRACAALVGCRRAFGNQSGDWCADAYAELERAVLALQGADQ